jgi:hypothetical protein
MVTVAVNRGLWSGPSLMLAYSGKVHNLCWHSSCSLDLYIAFGLLVLNLLWVITDMDGGGFVLRSYNWFRREWEGNPLSVRLV